ncbi:hypothetical protein [Pandoraea sp. ISTKB]|uniref:hypothetical protein n=1 Tax=Pandoraea sp. ISTKB TaxID=1586708 RepID=UPI0008463F2B|nr:hypothetical protein [Pandoraea sp. ISTKB]ODP35022.1 hypothetical protein A9762_11700 [Pandoraea sp. ISTKB]
MKPSMMASSYQGATPVAYVSFAEMGEMVRTRGLHASSVTVVRGAEIVRAVANAQKIQEVEDGINNLLVSVRSSQVPGQRPAALERAMAIAQQSSDAHQLQYLTSMFIHEPTVISQLAKNKALPVVAQQIIINDADLQRNSSVMRGLAENPALPPELMRRMLNDTDDDLVRHLLVQKAAERSRNAKEANDPYVKICDEVADTTFDNSLRLTAISGARSAAVLRKIAKTRDVVLGARELEAVADNIYTPSDVLSSMASVPPTRQAIYAAFGVTVAQKASRTLQVQRERNFAVEPVPEGSVGGPS